MRKFEVKFNMLLDNIDKNANVLTLHVLMKHAQKQVLLYWHRFSAGFALIAIRSDSEALVIGKMVFNSHK